MKSYTDKNSKAILKRILELLREKEYSLDIDIDSTYTIIETDIQDVIMDLDISILDFGMILGLREVLTYENFKIRYMDSKILKVEREREREQITFTEMPKEYPI
jgi:hypothetical protein